MRRNYYKKVVNRVIVWSISSALLFVVVYVLPAQALVKQPRPSATPDRPAEGVLSEKEGADVVIQSVINYITWILAGLFVMMMLIGAIMYMVYPDADKKEKGMIIIKSAITAGILAMLSWTIWNIMEYIL